MSVTLAIICLGLTAYVVQITIKPTSITSRESSRDTQTQTTGQSLENTLLVTSGYSSHPPHCDQTGMKPYNSPSGYLSGYTPCTEIEILNSKGIYILPMSTFNLEIQKLVPSDSTVIRVEAATHLPSLGPDIEQR